MMVAFLEAAAARSGIMGRTSSHKSEPGCGDFDDYDIMALQVTQQQQQQQDDENDCEPSREDLHQQFNGSLQTESLSRFECPPSARFSDSVPSLEESVATSSVDNSEEFLHFRPMHYQLSSIMQEQERLETPPQSPPSSSSSSSYGHVQLPVSSDHLPVCPLLSTPQRIRNGSADDDLVSLRTRSVRRGILRNSAASVCDGEGTTDGLSSDATCATEALLDAIGQRASRRVTFHLPEDHTLDIDEESIQLNGSFSESSSGEQTSQRHSCTPTYGCPVLASNEELDSREASLFASIPKEDSMFMGNKSQRDELFADFDLSELLPNQNESQRAVDATQMDCKQNERRTSPVNDLSGLVPNEHGCQHECHHKSWDIDLHHESVDLADLVPRDDDIHGYSPPASLFASTPDDAASSIGDDLSFRSSIGEGSFNGGESLSCFPDVSSFAGVDSPSTAKKPRAVTLSSPRSNHGVPTTSKYTAGYTANTVFPKPSDSSSVPSSASSSPMSTRTKRATNVPPDLTTYAAGQTPFAVKQTLSTATLNRTLGIPDEVSGELVVAKLSLDSSESRNLKPLEGNGSNSDALKNLSIGSAIG